MIVTATSYNSAMSTDASLEDLFSVGKKGNEDYSMMPSPRRMRLVFLAAVVTVVLVMFYSSRPSPDARTIQDFYHKTMDGMKKDAPPGQAIINAKTGQKAGYIPADKDGDGDVDEDDKKAAAVRQMALKQAEQKAKDNANNKGGLKPDVPSEVVGKGNSAVGQPKKGKMQVVNVPGKSTEKTQVKAKETNKEHRAELELDAILNKSPVVIFSKTYCPHSKRAKGVLLEKYIITPDPFVVELDEHPIGPALQDALYEKTGRKTVPNVLINGISIGGGDDVVDLDNNNKLAGKIKMLGKKRLQVSQRFTSGDKIL
ncbi:hypothetical protein EsDP_00002953 [Epichloe bromicola]|uniref:Glutaredoxin domain-containing protein n=1 Tax=Epichloe bromicola TaxID=79588 RepID=A0ABQ0CMC5_9HYPO